MSESEKQFSFTRAASSSSGRARKQLLISPITLSLITFLATLIVLAGGCGKSPTQTQESPSTKTFEQALQTSRQAPPPIRAEPFHGQVYESINGRDVITLVSPDELEKRERGVNIIAKYTKQDGKLRVIANVLGTTAAVYYRITEEGLQGDDGQILYEPGRLLKVRQIVEMNNALVAAVEAGDANAAEAQLRKGGNQKLLCNRKTLLCYAFEHSNLAMVKVLLDAGVDPNAFDPNGQPAPIPCRTVLDGSTDILKELIRKGANINLHDEFGNTAFYYCMNIWLSRGNETAKRNAIALFEAGARFSEEEQAGWKSLTHGVPGGESWTPSAEQEALAKPREAGAQIDLGRMYENGQAVAKNEVEAVKWYRKAADQNNAEGQCSLGWMYAKGHGVGKDELEAVKCYRKAAEQGNARAQYNLGAMYENGRGVAKDEAEAVKWYRKAAEQGSANAQYKLGTVYEIAKDKVEAVKWYRKAAEGGSVEGLNDAAWILATSANPEMRDGSNAMLFAERAVAATNRKHPSMLGTLAAAYAEVGQFEKAVSTEQEALTLPQTEVEKNNRRNRLKLYEAKTPYHAKD